MPDRQRMLRSGGQAKSFFSQSTAVIAGNACSALLALLYVSFISRRLGPAGYGSVTAAISLGSILLLPVGPLAGTLTKFSAAYHRENDRGRLNTLAFGSLRTLAVPGLALIVLVLLVSPLIGKSLHLDGMPLLIALSFFVMLSAFIAFPRSVLAGQQRFLAYSANQVAEAFARLLLGSIGVFAAAQVSSAVAGYALGVVAALALGLFQLRELRREEPSPVDLRELVSFSVPVALVYAYGVASSNLDMLFAKRYLGDTDAGLYAAASALARMLFMVGTPIYTVLYSRVSSLKTGADARRLSLQVLALMASGLAVSFAIPWFAGGLCLKILFGAAYAGAIPVLRILWLAVSLLVLQVAASHYLLAVERMRAAWLYLLPCLVLAGLLWQFHQSPIEVAFCSLAAAGCGFLLTAFLVSIVKPHDEPHVPTEIAAPSASTAASSAQPPVVLFTYNRPLHTAQVLAALEKRPPEQLIIFQDGAKSANDSNHAEVTRLIESIAFIKPRIVRRPKNLGLAGSIIQGVTEAFETHESIVVLEDDCVPSTRLIDYMTFMLAAFRDQPRVFSISGYALPACPPDYPFDICFSPLSSSWGWGTWKNRWAKFDAQTTGWQSTLSDRESRHRFAAPGELFPMMLRHQMAGLIDSWAIRWYHALFLHRAVCAWPLRSYVRNIGMDGTGAHDVRTHQFDVELSENFDPAHLRIPPTLDFDPEIQEAFRDSFNPFSLETVGRVLAHPRSWGRVARQLIVAFLPPKG